MPITEMKRSLSLTKLLFPVVRPGFYFLILVCCIKKRKTNKQAKKYNQVLQHTLMMFYRLLHSLYQKGNKTQSLCFDAKRRKCHRFLYFQFDFCFLPDFSSVFHCTSAKKVKAPRLLDTYAISPIIRQVFTNQNSPSEILFHTGEESYNNKCFSYHSF